MRPAERPTCESRIAVALWAWSNISPEDVPGKDAARKRFAGVLEHFYGVIFQMRKQRPESKWWTDGVLSCYLVQRCPTLFEAHGSLIWADGDEKYLQAPFAASFEFVNPNNQECERIVLRFGRRNADGTIRRVGYNATAKDNIPASDEDWAFAVELS